MVGSAGPDAELPPAQDEVIPMKLTADPVAAEPERFRRVGSFIHDAQNPTHLYWGRYCDWRVTKCPRHREEAYLVQPTMELIGEIAELSLLFYSRGYRMFVDPDAIETLLDEAGDVIFCAAWAMDAWKWNLLRAMGDCPGASILPPGDVEPELKLREALLKVLRPEDGEIADEDVRVVVGYEQYMVEKLLSASCHFGMTANAAKKLAFHSASPGSPQKHSESIMMGLAAIQKILCLHGFSIHDALAANVAKLDARFPDGYKPGGGVR